MKNLLVSFWNDEQGLITSLELVFTVSILAIGMIVGLSAYRDGVIEELADNARAVAQLNQSYSVEVNAGTTTTMNTANSQISIAGITDGAVTITSSFGSSSTGSYVPNVTMTSSFNNFSYTDQADFCNNAPIQRSSPIGSSEATAPPAFLP